MQPTIFCRQCNQPIDATAQFCQRCGADQRAQAAAPPQVHPPAHNPNPTRRQPLTLAILVAILSVIVCALIFLIYTSHQADVPKKTVSTGASSSAPTPVAPKPIEPSPGLVTVSEVRKNILKYDKQRIDLKATVVDSEEGGTGVNALIIAVSTDEYVHGINRGISRENSTSAYDGAGQVSMRMVPRPVDLKLHAIIDVIGTYDAVTNTLTMSSYEIVGTEPNQSGQRE